MAHNQKLTPISGLCFMGPTQFTAKQGNIYEKAKNDPGWVFFAFVFIGTLIHHVVQALSI